MSQVGNIEITTKRPIQLRREGRHPIGLFMGRVVCFGDQHKGDLVVAAYVEKKTTARWNVDKYKSADQLKVVGGIVSVAHGVQELIDDPFWGPRDQKAGVGGDFVYNRRTENRPLPEKPLMLSHQIRDITEDALHPFVQTCRIGTVMLNLVAGEETRNLEIQ
jgi:hypothetical protein